MADPSELVLSGGGAVAVWEGVKFLAARFVRQADETQQALAAQVAAAEAERKADLDRRLEGITKQLDGLTLNVTGFVQKQAAQDAAIGAVAESIRNLTSRVEGYSGNHGARIGALEGDLREVRTEVLNLKARRRR